LCGGGGGGGSGGGGGGGGGGVFIPTDTCLPTGCVGEGGALSAETRIAETITTKSTIFVRYSNVTILVCNDDDDRIDPILLLLRILRGKVNSGRCEDGAVLVDGRRDRNDSSIIVVGAVIVIAIVVITGRGLSHKGLCSRTVNEMCVSVSVCVCGTIVSMGLYSKDSAIVLSMLKRCSIVSSPLEVLIMMTHLQRYSWHSKMLELLGVCAFRLTCSLVWFGFFFYSDDPFSNVCFSTCQSIE
jgi:hypothetical protein